MRMLLLALIGTALVQPDERSCKRSAAQANNGENGDQSEFDAHLALLSSLTDSSATADTCNSNQKNPPHQGRASVGYLDLLPTAAAQSRSQRQMSLSEIAVVRPGLRRKAQLRLVPLGELASSDSGNAIIEHGVAAPERLLHRGFRQ